MSRPTPDTAAPSYVSPTGLSPPVAVLPRDIRLWSSVTYAVHTPACTHTGLGSSAFARRYLRNHCYFLFLRLLRCFSSPGSLPPAYLFQQAMPDSSSGGFPHSDICGSRLMCSSPQLFAAYHVLLRLLMPRHPPYALISLIFFTSNFQS